MNIMSFEVLTTIVTLYIGNTYFGNFIA